MRLLPAVFVAGVLAVSLASCAGQGTEATGTGKAGDAQTEAAAEQLWVVSKETYSFEGDTSYVIETTYTLDEHGTRTGLVSTYFDEDPATFEITYELDENGYPVSAQGSTEEELALDSKVANEVDAEGRLVHRMSTGLDVTYSYDDQGKLVEIVTLEPSEVEGEGSASRAVTTLGEDGLVVAESYEMDGMVTASTFTYEYDEEGRPVKGIRTTRVDDNPESEFTTELDFTYDENGNLECENIEGLAGRYITRYEYVLVSDPSPAARHDAMTAHL